MPSVPAARRIGRRSKVPPPVGGEVVAAPGLGLAVPLPVQVPKCLLTRWVVSGAVPIITVTV